MSIVINTPTSNIARALAARLLDAGERVTVLSRDKKKVDELLRRGARVVEGSFEEPARLAKALDGAEALFWLTPPPAHRRAAPATSSERARRHAVPHEAGAPTSSEEQK
jgi:uncharacterized protein YbjT (DUF2867 family)